MFNLLLLFTISQRRIAHILFAAALLWLSAGKAGAQDCVCTNCPQFMPDGFTGTFNIQIQNATNPTLGQNGQGVCGVRLVFDHEYIGDLQITLTSPGGQTVTLIGPVGFFGPTDFTTWDVMFCLAASRLHRTQDSRISGTTTSPGGCSVPTTVPITRRPVVSKTSTPAR